MGFGALDSWPASTPATQLPKRRVFISCAFMWTFRPPGPTSACVSQLLVALPSTRMMSCVNGSDVGFFRRFSASCNPSCSMSVAE